MCFRFTQPPPVSFYIGILKFFAAEVNLPKLKEEQKIFICSRLKQQKTGDKTLQLLGQSLCEAPKYDTQQRRNQEQDRAVEYYDKEETLL